MERSFSRARGPLRGSIRVPGDKSLSHRAVLFAAMAEGTSRLEGVLDSADVRATIGAVQALGASCVLALQPDGSWAGSVTGWGAGGPVSPEGPVDCGNSGTTARLLMGVLAGWPVRVTLVGDESLSRRPMRRVTGPLSAMGAHFETTDAGTLPVSITGAEELRPYSYASPVASAQVKTAVILAGLRARGGVRVTEPAASRDHTERMLPAFGIALKVDAAAHAVTLCGPQVPQACDVSVPADPSSGAFMVAAALLVPASEVVLTGVSLNPTRTGFLEVLRRMGAPVSVSDATDLGAEPVGTITVRHTDRLSATTVTAEETPSLVDEVPVLALVASQARGTTRFEGIGELRVKESDRLAAVHEGLAALGVSVRSGGDWLEVDGPAQLRGATLDSLGDHRLAMCWALAGLVSADGVEVVRFDAIDVSYPSFVDDLKLLGA